MYRCTRANNLETSPRCLCAGACSECVQVQYRRNARDRFHGVGPHPVIHAFVPEHHLANAPPGVGHVTRFTSSSTYSSPYIRIVDVIMSTVVTSCLMERKSRVENLRCIAKLCSSSANTGTSGQASKDTHAASVQCARVHWYEMIERPGSATEGIPNQCKALRRVRPCGEARSGGSKLSRARSPREQKWTPAGSCSEAGRSRPLVLAPTL